MTKPPCSMPDCDRPWFCRDLCEKHYRKGRREGTLGRKHGPTCTVDGCELPHRRGGYCNMHSQRVRKYGEPGPAERLIAPDGTPWMVGAYLVVTALDHPLANVCGQVYVHRQVLYDTVGPEPQPCWGCGSMASLRQSISVLGEGPSQLVTITGDRTMRQDYVRFGQSSTDVRFRAQYWPWSATISVQVLQDQLTEDALIALVDAAGFGGIGEWRPSKSKTGDYGRFQVVGS